MRLHSTAFILTTFAAAGALFGQASSEPGDNLGRFERVTVHGSSLEGNLIGDSPVRDVSVYLPPSYGNGQNIRYPVLYLLHGYTDSDDRWFGLRGRHFVHVPGAVDAAFSRRLAREMIVVMPNAYNTFQGSMYSSSVAIGDWETFVAEDLVRFIDASYRTVPARMSRGLAGHSMGGYGAIRIAMKRPDVFAAVYSLSPCCMAANMNPNAEAVAQAEAIASKEAIDSLGFPVKAMLASAASWSPNPDNPPLYLDLPMKDGVIQPDVVAQWAANAPLAMVDQYIPNLKKFKAIAMDAGDLDSGIAATVRDLHLILNNYGIEHKFEIYGGNHVNRIHERLTREVLPFFTEHLYFSAEQPLWPE